MKKHINLEEIFDLEQWEELQDSLTAVTGLAIIMVDYKGEPKTKHSGCCDFCTQVRKDPELNQYCQKCDARGGLEAVRTNQPYIYKCYFSIIDIAIPIMVGGQYIGAIMAGQVRLKEDDETVSMEQIYIPSNKKYVDEKRAQYAAEYDKIPMLYLDRITMIVKMFYHLCNYTGTQFMKKNKIIQMYEDICKSNGITSKMEMEDTTPTPDGSLFAQQNENVLIDRTNLSNPIILKALNYIFEHKDESPSLEKMAKHCNISTGHLSRLFTKEAGENYSTFTSRLKIEWAKTMLETTDKSIYIISEELGFNETGYFIKIFKRYVGLTPAVYRSYIRKK